MLVSVVRDLQSFSNETSRLANALLHNPWALGNVGDEFEASIAVPIISMYKILKQREVWQGLRDHVVQS